MTTKRKKTNKAALTLALVVAASNTTANLKAMESEVIPESELLADDTILPEDPAETTNELEDVQEQEPEQEETIEIETEEPIQETTIESPIALTSLEEDVPTQSEASYHETDIIADENGVGTFSKSYLAAQIPSSAPDAAKVKIIGKIALGDFSDFYITDESGEHSLAGYSFTKSGSFALKIKTTYETVVSWKPVTKTYEQDLGTYSIRLLHTPSISVNGDVPADGGIDLSASAYEIGETVSFSVRSVEGYAYVVTDASGNMLSDSDGVYSYTMAVGQSFAVTYRKLASVSFEVSGASGDEFGASIASGYFESGTSVSFSVKEVSGYDVSVWDASGNALASVDGIYSVIVQGDLVISISYAKLYKPAFSINLADGGFDITSKPCNSSGYYRSTDTLTFTVSSVYGYSATVQDGHGNVLLPTDGIYSVPMNEDHHIYISYTNKNLTSSLTLKEDLRVSYISDKEAMDDFLLKHLILSLKDNEGKDLDLSGISFDYTNKPGVQNVYVSYAGSDAVAGTFKETAVTIEKLESSLALAENADNEIFWTEDKANVDAQIFDLLVKDGTLAYTDHSGQMSASFVPSDFTFSYINEVGQQEVVIAYQGNNMLKGCTVKTSVSLKVSAIRTLYTEYTTGLFGSQTNSVSLSDVKNAFGLESGTYVYRLKGTEEWRGNNGLIHAFIIQEDGLYELGQVSDERTKIIGEFTVVNCFRLRVEAGENGSVSIEEGLYPVSDIQTVSFTATPDAGYEAVVKVDGEIVDSYVLTMDASHTVSVEFVKVKQPVVLKLVDSPVILSETLSKSDVIRLIEGLYVKDEEGNLSAIDYSFNDISYSYTHEPGIQTLTVTFAGNDVYKATSASMDIEIMETMEQESTDASFKIEKNGGYVSYADLLKQFRLNTISSFCRLKTDDDSAAWQAITWNTQISSAGIYEIARETDGQYTVLNTFAVVECWKLNISADTMGGEATITPLDAGLYEPGTSFSFYARPTLDNYKAVVYLNNTRLDPDENGLYAFELTGNADLSIRYTQKAVSTLILKNQTLSVSYNPEESVSLDDVLSLIDSLSYEDSEMVSITPNASNVTYSLSDNAAGSQMLTITYLGDENILGCSKTVPVTITKASASISLPSVSVTAGESFDFAASTNPEGLAHIKVIAGIDGNAKGFASLYLADLFSDNAMGKAQYAALKLAVGEGLPLAKLDSILGLLGNDSSAASSLIELLQSLPIDTTIYLDKTPDQTGIYLTAALTVDANYETAAAMGTIAIAPQTEKVSLAFYETLPGKALTLAQAETFQFGGYAADNETVQVKTLYAGISAQGKVLTSTSPITIPGIYTETVYVLDSYYYAAPLVRTYSISRSLTSIQWLDEEKVVEYDGNAHALNAQVISDGNGIGTAAMRYAGLTTAGKFYNSETAPTEPGIYTVTASFAGDDAHLPSLSASLLTIKRNSQAVAIQLPDYEMSYGQELDEDALKAAISSDNERVSEEQLDIVRNALVYDLKDGDAGTYSLDAAKKALCALGKWHSNIQIQTGTVIINPALVQVELGTDASKIYDSTDEIELTLMLEGEDVTELFDEHIDFAHSPHMARTIVDGTPTHAGTYTIHMTWSGHSNYALENESQLFIIEQAQAQVIVESQTKREGDADPELIVEVQGIHEGDDVSFDIVREQGEEAGNYFYELENAGNRNYTLTLEGTPSLTILAKDADKSETDNVGTDNDKEAEDFKPSSDKADEKADKPAATALPLHAMGYGMSALIAGAAALLLKKRRK